MLWWARLLRTDNFKCHDWFEILFYSKNISNYVFWIWWFSYVSFVPQTTAYLNHRTSNIFWLNFSKLPHMLWCNLLRSNRHIFPNTLSSEMQSLFCSPYEESLCKKVFRFHLQTSSSAWQCLSGEERNSFPFSQEHISKIPL